MRALAGAVGIAVVLAGCATPGKTILPAGPMPDSTSTTCPTPKPTSIAEPVFPKAMLDMGQEGWVIVEFDVGVDGAPRNIHIWASSLPGGKFDVEVLRAFEKWRFGVSAPYVGCRWEAVFKVRR